MRRLSVVVLIILFVGAFGCFADLIPTATPPTNQVDEHGTGYGSVFTLLNAKSSSGAGSVGWEANCDIMSGGSVISSCSGPFASMTLQGNNNINNAWSLGDIGITDAATAASQLLLVFNINQEGGDQQITLHQIGLALWVGDTSIFSAVTLGLSDTYTKIEQGVGQSGFGYELDPTQAAAAQAAINDYIANHGASLDSIFVTGAFMAGVPPPESTANDGPENLYLRTQPATTVPDGGVTLILLGGALVGVETLRRRFRG